LRVKICGVTRVEDALVAERAGADAIGLIFAERSKRRVSLAQAAAISASLGPLMARVGVFVDAPREAVLKALSVARLTAVQLHGAEDAAYAAALREHAFVIKAVSVRPGFDAGFWRRFPADALLVDGLAPGAGKAFDWALVEGLKHHPRLILAGGLTLESVAAGVRALKPYGVDVASGVESSPGIKDPVKIQDFVRAARGA
jgi:phosphoribosylanthranilate isomerase